MKYINITSISFMNHSRCKELWFTYSQRIQIILAFDLYEAYSGNASCALNNKSTFLINPAVSEANMVDTCKHFEIGSGSVRSLSHLPVFGIEHPIWTK